jgi:hypothetical protein
VDVEQRHRPALGPVVEVAVALGDHAEVAERDDRRVQGAAVGDGVEIHRDAGVDGGGADLGHQLVDHQLAPGAAQRCEDQRQEGVAPGRERRPVAAQQGPGAVGAAEAGLHQPDHAGLDHQPVAQSFGEQPGQLCPVPAHQPQVVVGVAAVDEQRGTQQGAGGGAHLGLGLQVDRWRRPLGRRSLGRGGHAGAALDSSTARTVVTSSRSPVSVSRPCGPLTTVAVPGALVTVSRSRSSPSGASPEAVSPSRSGRPRADTARE